MRRWMILSGAAAAVWGLSLPAAAQAPDDRGWIKGVAYWADIDSQAAFTRTGTVEPPTRIDFESDLLLDDNQTLPAFNGGARLGGRFLLGFDYYALERTGEAGIAREIAFDDVVFPISATVRSSMDSDIYRLTLGWSLIHRPTFEAGPALGLHMANFDISLEGEARIGGLSAGTQVRRRDFLAPLPTLGLYANWRPTARVVVNARVDYMSLEYGDYDGGVTNMEVGASYRFTPRVGVGVLYRFVDYDLEINKDDWDGDLNYDFQGPAVFLEFAF